MIKNNLDSDKHKPSSQSQTKDTPAVNNEYVIRPKAKHYYNHVAEAAVGDLANEKIKHCYLCKDHGHPHEVIEIHKINGRLRNDRTYDVQGHDIRDYYTGSPHQHWERYYLGWNMERMLK
jgi:hypothetical protein